MWKKIGLMSILLNFYIIITLFFNAPFGFGGGKVLRLPNATTAWLSVKKDWLGVYRFYEFLITDGEGNTKDLCLIKPLTVVPWFELREKKEDVLTYDAKSEEIVCKIPGGYTLRKAVKELRLDN